MAGSNSPVANAVVQHLQSTRGAAPAATPQQTVPQTAAPASSPSFMSQQQFNQLHQHNTAQQNTQAYRTLAAARAKASTGLTQWQYQHPGVSAAQSANSYQLNQLGGPQSYTAQPAAAPAPATDPNAAAHAAQDAANPGLASASNYWSTDGNAIAQINKMKEGYQAQVGSLGTTYDPVTGLSSIPAAPATLGNLGSMTKVGADGKAYLVDANGNPIDTQDRGLLGQGWAQKELGLEGQYEQAGVTKNLAQQNLTNQDASRGALFSGMNAMGSEQNIANYTNTTAGLGAQASQATYDYDTAAFNAQRDYNNSMGTIATDAETAAFAKKQADPNSYLGGTVDPALAAGKQQQNNDTTATNPVTPNGTKLLSQAQYFSKHPGETKTVKAKRELAQDYQEYLKAARKALK